MARQVVDLTLGGEGWTGAVRLDAALVAGGQTAYLRLIRDVAGSVQFELAINATVAGSEPGPHFTPELERADEAFTFVGPGSSTLVLKGPDHPDNTFADPDEPYFWTPDNAADAQAWFVANSFEKVRLTLDDGIEATLLRGAASAGAAEARARLEITQALTVRGRAAAGAALARARVERVPALTLADFDADGLELDVLALIRAGAAANGSIFAGPPRPAVGALLDGELGLGAGDVPITRLRRRNGNMFVVNDSGPFSVADYFNAGGEGADLTVYLQTRDGAASFPVATHGSTGPNFIQIGALDAAFQALLDSIADGDLFIFALARPTRTVIALRGTASAGAAEAAARVLPVTPAVHSIAGRAEAGAAESAARLRRIPALAIRGAASAGAAQARASIRLARPLAIRGTASAGAAESTARLRRIPALAIRGAASAGAAQARASIRLARPLAIRGTASAGAAESTARLRRIPALAIRGAASAGAAQARARLRLVTTWRLRGLAESGGAQVSAHLRRRPPAAELYDRTIRESAPEHRLLTALEIRHPAVAAPVRVINDSEERTIEGSRYIALRFDARLADDVEGQAPQAELGIDNVGRELTQWIEAAGGGTGATVRVMQVLDIPDPEVEWELTMDVAGMQLDAERVTARLGFDPLLGRAAVTLRHDPQTSPGLF